MVHEIREKNLFQQLKTSAKEIGYKTIGAYAFLGTFALAITITFVLSQQKQTILQRAAGSAPEPYTYNFDGDPSAPQSKYWMEDFDVQVHTRATHFPDLTSVGTDFAQHGTGCEAPPETHPVGSYEDVVFHCKNHLMTTIGGGYGVIYLTPNRLLDWSDGEAILSVDVSTEVTSVRDWWDIWLTAWDENLTLPIGPVADGVDLQGHPNGDFLNVGMHLGEKWFEAQNEDTLLPSQGGSYSASSARQRDTFELRITPTTFSFCKPDENICWYKDAPHGLTVTRALVQLGHHAYDPTKDGIQNTWHWDNLYLSDSVPFTLIRANQRHVTNGPWHTPTTDQERTITFDQPAPANSYLRFSAIGKVRINGDLVNPQVPTYSPEHFNSYFVPIPEGTTSVVYKGEADSWFDCGFICAARDISIFSQNVPGGSNPPPTIIQNTPTNTPVPQQQPTATNTPVPNQPTPTPLPKLSNLLLTPATGSFNINQTFPVEVRVNTNGQSVNGVETTINFPSQTLSVESVTKGVFEVEAENTTGNGTVSLAYGTTSPKSGNQLVATINFRALVNGSASVTLSNSSILSSLSNGDVLNNVSGATYTILAQPTATPTPLQPTPTPTRTPAQIADFNNSGTVDIQDLSYLLSRWSSNDSTADINGDGNVTILDLSVLLSNWGQ